MPQQRPDEQQQSPDVIEIRPHRGGWQCFEASGVEPYWIGEGAKEAPSVTPQRARSFDGEKFACSTLMDQLNKSRSTKPTFVCDNVARSFRGSSALRALGFTYAANTARDALRTPAARLANNVRDKPAAS